MDINTDIKYTHTNGEYNINVDEFTKACKKEELEYIPWCVYLTEGDATDNGTVCKEDEFIVHMLVKDKYGNRIRLSSDIFKRIKNKE